MTILIVLTLLLVAGILVVNFGGYSEIAEFGGGALVVAAGVVLLALLVLLPFKHMEVESKIQEVYAVQDTAKNFRNSGETWESASFQREVAEVNKWIASAQYYNDSVFDIWIPDEVEDLEPVE